LLRLHGAVAQRAGRGATSTGAVPTGRDGLGAWPRAVHRAAGADGAWPSGGTSAALPTSAPRTWPLRAPRTWPWWWSSAAGSSSHDRG